jgi:hypothetical protein
LENRNFTQNPISTYPKILKLGGCIATLLKSILSQPPSPLGSISELFKIQSNFGQTSYSLLLFSLILSHSLANQPSEPGHDQPPLFIPFAL